MLAKHGPVPGPANAAVTAPAAATKDLTETIAKLERELQVRPDLRVLNRLNQC